MKDTLSYIGLAVWILILLITYFQKIREPDEKQVVLVNPIKRRPDSQRYLTLSKLISKDEPKPITKELTDETKTSKTKSPD